MWDEITYPFPIFNCVAVKHWQWISNFLSQFITVTITYPYWDSSISMLVKKATGDYMIVSGKPTLWCGVPVAPVQKSVVWDRRSWKFIKKLSISCESCTYRFIRYPLTRYRKVRIDPLIANMRNPNFFGSPAVNAAWFVVVRPWLLNKALLNGLKGY